MKIVIFGLSVSSSWGNGHATLWRGLCGGLAELGHLPVFFERDVPYYAAHRDLNELAGGKLYLYPDWDCVISRARVELSDADVVIITSYCPDGIAASELALSSGVALSAFYDLDTPVTLDRLRSGQTVEYLPPNGLRDFDLVLSYTGGTALMELQRRLGARRVAPLYGSVDPSVHRPVDPLAGDRSDLSYLGTFAEDRQQGVNELFIEPARRMPERR
ncbi:MAG: glycosyltransferase, partial [Acidobacteriota bacterium]|nr:glycosyltransferase [Acidobacteriota bacterium]